MQYSWKNPVSIVHGKEPSKHFDIVLDRTETDWPRWLMPSAPGAVVANEQLVHHATSGCPQISPHRRWLVMEFCRTHAIRIETNRAIFLMPIGKWWFIIRSSRSNPCCTETLASICGPAPIFAEDVEAAKKLAVYYYFLPTEKSDRVFWADGGVDSGLDFLWCILIFQSGK
jgi:hypothetical protein